MRQKVVELRFEPKLRQVYTGDMDGNWQGQDVNSGLSNPESTEHLQSLSQHFTYPWQGSASLVSDRISFLSRAKEGVSILQKLSEPGVKYISFVFMSFVNYSRGILT